MTFAQSKPEVRNVEPFPIDHDGERLIHLRDPFNIADNSLTLSIPAYFLVTMMNGEKTAEEIRTDFNTTYKANVSMDDLESLVKTLTDNYFMIGDRFEEKKNAVLKAFRDAEFRESFLAGRSYPETAKDISELLDLFMNGLTPPEKAPFAIIAPHIDLKAGGRSFGAAYAQLKNSTAETFVILGIGHALSEDFFAGIDKGFRTPLGVSPVDGEFLEELEKEFGEPVTEQMYAHKAEHSVEFQVLFLQKLFGDAQPPRKIVPILLSFPETIGEIDDPRFNAARVGRFATALRKVMDARDGKVCLIAGIDLSHIGRRFGQVDGAPEERLKKVEEEDREVMKYVAAGNKEQFVEYMKKVNPENHVCGYPALYTLFDLLGGREGELLDYRQNVEGENDSMVSFTSMKFD